MGCTTAVPEYSRLAKAKSAAWTAEHFPHMDVIRKAVVMEVLAREPTDTALVQFVRDFEFDAHRAYLALKKGKFLRLDKIASIPIDPAWMLTFPPEELVKDVNCRLRENHSNFRSTFVVYDEDTPDVFWVSMYVKC